jgi:2-aminoethylphosphonate-pyruvate transaminase
VIMQGSGTFGVESVLSSSVPASGGKVIIFSNGSYGDRMAKMCIVHRIPHVVVRISERLPVLVPDVEKALAAHADATHVAIVHHETTAGVLNPIADIGRALRVVRPDITYIVDSMSAFGAYPVDMAAGGAHETVDFLVSSSNKCIEGVPGFSYSICSAKALAACEGRARSLALDLFEQAAVLRKTRQFRFTPPTHALLAFRQALREHKEGGGAPGRLARYHGNFRILKDGMAALGFSLYVAEGPYQGCIISTFLWPDDAKFSFERKCWEVER